MSGLNAAQVHELTHRLQTLEIDLHEAAQSRLITEADYSARLERLRRAMAHADKLKKMAMTQTMASALPSQVDLPVMGDYSRVEQKIVSRFVADTKVYTNELASKVIRAADWARDAANGGSGWIRSMWRLSWLRGQIRRIDQDIASVRKARAVVEDFVARSAITGNEPNSRMNQKDLLTAFHEFEASTGRVTALRARVRSEMVRNNDMRTWLNQYSENRRSVNPEMIPPQVNDVNNAVQSVTERLTGGARIANERLVIARQLAEALNSGSAGRGVEMTDVDSVASSTGVKKAKNNVAHSSSTTNKGARQ